MLLMQTTWWLLWFLICWHRLCRKILKRCNSKFHLALASSEQNKCQQQQQLQLECIKNVMAIRKLQLDNVARRTEQGEESELRAFCVACMKHFYYYGKYFGYQKVRPVQAQAQAQAQYIYIEYIGIQLAWHIDRF